MSRPRITVGIAGLSTDLHGEALQRPLDWRVSTVRCIGNDIHLQGVPFVYREEGLSEEIRNLCSSVNSACYVSILPR